MDWAASLAASLFLVYSCGHALSKVHGTSTHRAEYPGRWPGNTHARPPSDVNKPRTHRPRAPVQGLFSPSHVLAHTAPGPAWADADARQPALPLPARLHRLSARAPNVGPVTPAPRQACFGRVFRSRRTTAPPPAPPHASRPGEGSTGAPTEWAPAPSPRHVPGVRRPCRLRVPRARPARGPATLTRLSACFAWRPRHARVPLPAELWPRERPPGSSAPPPANSAPERPRPLPGPALGILNPS
ncbi:nematocyst expressed protein 3-like [Hippopotamus amphibius kiboko]|uniref:nematocyst expressed protein 3-like n=1 Tax=Hippopotamus amphibius kiboko TaxID=575201 RepID=UPI0025989FB9|nr:nematocyst expressed protein 3-like [Hippopotamus amphibius kiboko]